MPFVIPTSHWATYCLFPFVSTQLVTSLRENICSPVFVAPSQFQFVADDKDAASPKQKRLKSLRSCSWTSALASLWSKVSNTLLLAEDEDDDDDDHGGGAAERQEVLPYLLTNSCIDTQRAAVLTLAGLCVFMMMNAPNISLLALAKPLRVLRSDSAPLCLSA